jgi:L-threonylcarbamoyladenylate synthase
LPRRASLTGDNESVNTLRLSVDPDQLERPSAQNAIARAASILRSGGLVALPTETVYGLGANALDPAAVERIFAAKQRPSWDPVIVHIAGPAEDNPMLSALVTEIPKAARKLVAAFWPGPLTLLLPRSKTVPDAVTAGRPLVGVRMPGHPVALALIHAAGVPVAAPSANLFSHTSPTTAEHVLHDLDGRIDAILDAGPTLHGVESTVLDPCRTPMLIYRPGAVTSEQIRAVVGVDVEIYRAEISSEAPAALPSPGVGIRHYAPRARVVLVEGKPAELAASAAEHAGRRVGVMLPSGWPSVRLGNAATFQWGPWDAPDELAARLYAGLRALDAQGCDVIVCPLPPSDGIGAAIRDRLHKAAWSEKGEHPRS